MEKEMEWNFQNDRNNSVCPIVSSSGIAASNGISEVPEPYNAVFAEYNCFNPIQSAIFQDVFYSDNSIAVAAPTGSGKTVIFELAIIKLLIEMEKSRQTHDFKIIYVAPMKTLCEERLVDWHRKFSPFDVKCISVTGDTENVDYRTLFRHNLIITTPEKWDSVTRHWRDHENLVEAVRLFLIDEIHLINDEIRGATLEAIITRMKTIFNSSRIANSSGLRFVGVSATVANIEDISGWFATGTRKSSFFQFKDDMRPVQLKKIVLGYPYNPASSSPFKFDIALSYKLHGVVLQYSLGKPTLVFCSTRKSVEMTSKQLTMNLTVDLSPAQKKVLVEAVAEIRNPKLAETLAHGVGAHHAGMPVEHRRAVERLFRDGFLPVLVTTSTLAVGVNLPAHLVVVKSTKHYVNGEYRNYGASMLFQMIGRAGRPQFDTSGTAVIMTTQADKHKYENMISGEQPIESHIRRQLAELINAEVVLRTITDLSVATEWLSSTFFYIRAKKNPKYYGLPSGLPAVQLDQKLLEICRIEVNKLCRSGMSIMDTNLIIEPTETGSLMAKYCVSYESMKLFTELSGKEALQQILSVLSKCEEFHEIRLRSNDKSALNVLNRSKNRRTIRFPLTGRIRTLDMKINCIIQAVLGCLDISEMALVTEAQKIMRIGERVLTCLAEYMRLRDEKSCYKASLSSILLLKCFRARIWENSEYVSRQLEGIGTTLSNSLVAAGKTSFKTILNSNPRDLERIVNKKPPFGNNLHDQVFLIPIYQMNAEITEREKNAIIHVEIVMENVSNFEQKMTVNPSGFMHLIVGFDDELLLHKKFTHLEMVERKKIDEKIEVVDSGSKIEVLIDWISDDWVGFDVEKKFVLFNEKNESKRDDDDTNKATKAIKKTKSDSKLGKPMKKKILLQQPMDRYFKNVKLLKRKKSSENSRKSQQEKVLIDEKKEVKEDEKRKQELLEMGEKFFNNSMATYLKCLNKKVFTENVDVEKLSQAIEDISSVIKPEIRDQTENVLKAIENTKDYMKSTGNPPEDVQRQVKKIVNQFNPTKTFKAKENRFPNAMEFEASLPPNLEQFAKTEKKKLPAEPSKTITWKSPLIQESPNFKIKENQPNSNPKAPKASSSYSLSDKDWGEVETRKFEEIASKSFIDFLFGSKENRSQPKDNDNFNNSVSSSSSGNQIKSVKTTYAESVTSYSHAGLNVMADKIKSALPRINKEIKEDNIKQEDKRKENDDVEELLKSKSSWEKEFLSEDFNYVPEIERYKSENLSFSNLEYSKGLEEKQEEINIPEPRNSYEFDTNLSNFDLLAPFPKKQKSHPRAFNTTFYDEPFERSIYHRDHQNAIPKMVPPRNQMINPYLHEPNYPSYFSPTYSPYEFPPQTRYPYPHHHHHQFPNYNRTSPYFGNPKPNYFYPKPLHYSHPNYNEFPGYQQTPSPANYDFHFDPQMSPFETSYGNHNDLDLLLSFDEANPGRRREEFRGNYQRNDYFMKGEHRRDDGENC